MSPSSTDWAPQNGVYRALVGCGHGANAAYRSMRLRWLAPILCYTLTVAGSRLSSLIIYYSLLWYTPLLSTCRGTCYNTPLVPPQPLATLVAREDNPTEGFPQPKAPCGNKQPC